MSDVKLVGAFIDTLILNVYPTNASYEVERQELSRELQAELEVLKQQAQEEEEEIETRFFFGGSCLTMRTKGSEGFNWILHNHKITLAVKRSAKMLLWAQVRCSSEYLWGVRDLGKVLSEVYVFLTSIFGNYIVLQPSALDLAADVVGLELGHIHDVKEHFISRAQMTDQKPAHMEEVFIDGPDSIKQRWGRLTGLPFGARNAAVSALIYDKTHEIKYHSKEKSWFFDLWQAAACQQGFEWTPEQKVWRIEIRFKRAALSEMCQKAIVSEDGETKEKMQFHGINDAFDLDLHIPGLWSYAVGHVEGGADGLPDGWLRYVLPSEEDSNRARWSVHPDWHVIQSAFVVPDLEETEYQRKEREELEKEELLLEVDAYLEAHPFISAGATSPGEEKQVQAGTEEKSPFKQGVSYQENAVIHLGPYQRRRKQEVNVQRMVAQVVGCLSTYEAFRSIDFERGEMLEVEPDMSLTLHSFYQAAETYLTEKKKDYLKMVQKKRVLYHIERAIA